MYQSIRTSQLILRIGLALVFLWFGIDKFIEPQHFIDSWMPMNMVTALAGLHIGARDFMFLVGIFEVLVAVSLASGFFMRIFAAPAILFLLSLFVIHGVREVLIPDIGLIAGLAALILWPERTYI